jgi:hypothetical protein
MIAVIGVTALWLLYGWLACSIASSYLSERKGYGLRPGLAAGLLLAPIGVIIFLLIPARETSDWKVVGPFGRSRVDAADAARTDS